jgi:hypothetical protein
MMFQIVCLLCKNRFGTLLRIRPYHGTLYAHKSCLEKHGGMARVALDADRHIKDFLERYRAPTPPTLAEVSEDMTNPNSV